MAPDGSRFMAGLTMYDTATLGILGQYNNAMAPFTFTAAFSILQNLGGSAFTADGSTLYSAFNVAPLTTPTPRPQASTLLVSDPRNLTIKLGIKLPESIVAKMVITQDGSSAWGMSESGLIYLPFGHLYDYPILQPESPAVFLAQDACNRGLATAKLKVDNLGGGTATFSIVNTNGALTTLTSSGVAPTTITLTMDPGRSGVVRQAGTNLWTGAGTQNGTPLTVTLSSSNAINVPNTINVYMNYRQSDQRGMIFPVPTTPNNNPANVGAPGANEGLQDLVLDEPRGLLYVSNSGYNRIEVFDLVKQRFGAPIPVGAMPHSMAMSTDGNTLYVANTGGEMISMVDLSQQAVVGTVAFPPIPRSGTQNLVYPRALAMGLFGPQVVMSNGSQWKVVNGVMTVRPANSVTPATLPTTGGAPAYGMVATPDNKYIITLAGNGAGYLYDGTADTYTASRTLFGTIGNPIQGFYGILGAGPAGNYFLANGLILNSAMAVIGGSPTPSAPTSGAFARNIAAAAPLNDHQFLWMTTPVRANITTATRDDPRATMVILDLNTGTTSLAGVAPENPAITALGTTRYNVSPRRMVVDSKGTAYAISLTGLSVIPVTTPPGPPQIAPGARGIVNSSDGTQNISPGSFITITGTNLASTGVADTLPPPTILGGSCVTFNDMALALLQTSTGQIQAQVPDNLPAGINVVAVRSLANAQASDPVILMVQKGQPSAPSDDQPSQTGARRIR
jgi:DNA-binding beta-propeller fold protein YncE